MKKQLNLLYILALLLIACQHRDDTKIQNVELNIQKTILKPFSDSLKQDTFQIRLTGKTPEDMSLIFIIRSFKGKQIYRQIFSARTIIGNYKNTVDLKSEADQLTFLKEEINLFFEEENFLEPAITTDEIPDKNTVDKPFYKELQKSHLNGFKYRVGNDTKFYIAWSTIEQKVKVYYKCC